jgi:hypothetical protein
MLSSGRKNMLKTPLGAIALVLCASAARAEPITIKGIGLGMAKEEVTNAIREQNLAGGFGIAGLVVHRSYPKVRGLPTVPTYQDDKLATFMVLYHPTDFAAVEAAMRKKYPGTDCTDQILQNAFGAKYNQRKCIYKEGEELLAAYRYAGGDTKNGAMFLGSTKRTPEQERAASAAQSDL